MKRILWIGLVSFVILALAGQVVFGAEKKPPVPKDDWEKTWNKIVSDAKKEGGVTVYSSYPSEFRVALSKGFKDKFGLDIDFVTGRGAELREKLARERRTGMYLADIYMMGPSDDSLSKLPGTVFDPMPPILVLPEVVDGRSWTGGKLTFGDVRGEYVAFFALTPYSFIAANTGLVKVQELQSLQDLLEPKHKGRIVLGDPTTTGAAMEWFGTVINLFGGRDFMNKLARQDPIITRDERQAVEWVAKEKYSIVIGIKPALVNQFILKGAPIDWAVVKETWLSSQEATVALVNKAAHPEAAKVYLNWLLSKEGQSLFSKVTGLQSARVDVDASHIPKGAVRIPGKKYPLSADAPFWARQKEYGVIAKEVFKNF